MGAVGMLAGNEARRRGRGIVVLVLMVGVIGAIVLATAAAARRSSTALARFNAYGRSADVELNVGRPEAAQIEAFARSPGVAAVARLNAVGLDFDGLGNLPIAAAIDERRAITSASEIVSTRSHSRPAVSRRRDRRVECTKTQVT